MSETNTFTSPLNEKKFSALTLDYWKMAASNIKDVKILAIAAVFIAMRIAVKFLVIPIGGESLKFSFDCYVNSVGSLIYGPVVGLVVGAVSDTLGFLIKPSGAYFFPYIFVEMSSSFIFGIFLWKRKISAPRVLLSKFTVNLVCNIILTSAIMKLQKFMIGESYNLINLVRIVKNLVTFPVEAMLITILIGALLPAFKSMHLVSSSQENIKLRIKDIVLIAVLLALSVGLVVFYVTFLKDFISEHNFKLL